MRLFLQILFWIVFSIAILIGLIWGWAKFATRSGPEAPPLASLSQADFQSAIDALRAERRIVGLVGRVDVGGMMVAEAASGFLYKDSEEPLGPDNLFHVGSIGKSMSATAIATLVEDGLLSWDSTVGGTLTEFDMTDGWEAVTLTHLLSHTGGVPRVGLLELISLADRDAPLPAQRRAVAERLLSEAPVSDPGATFAYSNEGYMLASMMAEAVTGTDWETLLQARFAAPLGMTTLALGAPPMGEPWGHRSLLGFKFAMTPLANPDNPPWMSAAGALHLSLDDLARHGRAHLEAGQGDAALLTPASFDYLHTPVRNNYALGWGVRMQDLGEGEETVIAHNGSNTMWYAVLMLFPDRDASVMLLTNDPGNLNKTMTRFNDFAREIARQIPMAE